MLPPLIFVLDAGTIIDPGDPGLPFDPSVVMRTALSRDFTVDGGDLRVSPPERISLLEVRVAGDIEVADNDLVTDEGLETALLLSLFTDRRAEDGDALPFGDVDRRGWFGDDLADVSGDRFGSRLWLLTREKELSLVLVQAEAYAREALQWLIDDEVATQFEVRASVYRPGWLGLEVVLQRPGVGLLRYQYAWDAQAARAR